MRPLAWLQLHVFLGAALLFTMEPMVGRLLLPAFGSAFHVWSTTLMFFQGALLLGYLYAHLVAPRIGRLHLALLLLPLAFLPFEAPQGLQDPSIGGLLRTLTLRFGVPFVALATTSVVAQQWLTQSDLDHRDDPYGLYASSNAGSLLALLAYVFLWEPLAGLRQQAWLWAAGYLAYLLTAQVSHRRAKPRESAALVVGPRPSLAALLGWVALAAVPSAFSLAVSNLFVLDLGNAPFVWVPPLVVYLLTFILVFGRARFRPRWFRRLWPHITVIGLAAYVLLPGVQGVLAPLVHLAILFVVGLAAHGELHAARPKPRSLTWFYLALALGGWIGSVLVSVVAPFVFDQLWEYPLSILALWALMGLRRRAWTLPSSAMLSFGVVLAAAAVAVWSRPAPAPALAAGRSPYGVYRVDEGVDDGLPVRRLYSGRTLHGRQRIEEGRGRSATLAREPAGYYAATGPLGDALRSIPRPRRLGVVGLGVGAVAGHLGPGESVTFFEIDPLVSTLARRWFSYLDGPARVRIVHGDARHRLAQEDAAGAAPYDLLFVDAFSGDAVPLHLLTREALALYLRRVGGRGLLVFHVSNRYFDLAPSLRAAAEALGLGAWIKEHTERLAPLEDPSRYVLVGPAERSAPFAAAGWRPIEAAPVLLTDDRSSLLWLRRSSD